jgi:phosphoribosylcarboxyaminoimidazole (NCAIR) mutase
MATMSPSEVSGVSIRFSPSNVNSFVILTVSSLPSVFETATSCPVLSVPLKTRAIASRPR